MSTELLLIDGSCGLCRRIARYLDRHSGDQSPWIAPYQSLSNEELHALGVTRDECAREVLFFSVDGRLHRGAAAVNQVLARWHTGRYLVWIFTSVPTLYWVEKQLYRFVSPRRHTISALLRIS
jgi:predicted DCC family thiol-disulfide oxidoreductase YuxK